MSLGDSHLQNSFHVKDQIVPQWGPSGARVCINLTRLASMGSWFIVPSPLFLPTLPPQAPAFEVQSS